MPRIPDLFLGDSRFGHLAGIRGPHFADTFQNCSLTVNWADRGPPKAYWGLCPVPPPPPPKAMFVVQQTVIWPKPGRPRLASGSVKPGAPNIGWLKTLKYSARALRLK